MPATETRETSPSVRGTRFARASLVADSIPSEPPEVTVRRAKAPVFLYRTELQEKEPLVRRARGKPAPPAGSHTVRNRP